MVRLLREPVLAAAAAASVALALTILVLPRAPWLAPLALLGGIWAPGYAGVRLVYPVGRLSGIERHAVSAGAGLLLLPILVLALSLARAFGPETTALALCAFTLLASLVATRSQAFGIEVEPPARAAVPGTRPTLALAAASLAICVMVLGPTLLRADAAPAALALTAVDGGPIPLEIPAGAHLRVHVTAYAGGAAREGRIVASWDGAVVGGWEVELPPGGQRTFEVEVPSVGRGAHALEVSWEGQDREVHALVQGARA